MQYNWQQKDWPNFKYDLSTIEDQLLLYIEKTARLSGILEALPADDKMAAIIETITNEAIKTSEIEGEYIERSDVKSSILNNLGISEKIQPVYDLRARGLGEMITAVRHSHKNPLSENELFSWHSMLLSYREDLEQIGKWRTHEEPMRIVSGAMGKEKIHFEAPPSKDVPKEMQTFIRWFNSTAPKETNSIRSALVRSAIAHLYFESIHPFEDGNGRIGRALAEKALSQHLGGPIHFSISKTIESNKKAYYQNIEAAQRSNEITQWMNYFIPMVLDAVQDAEQEIDFTIKKAKFYDLYKEQLNERQSKVIHKMFEAGPSGFERGMNARKFVSIAKISKATATRDLQYLNKIGALVSIGSGRSTRYQLAI